MRNFSLAFKSMRFYVLLIIAIANNLLASNGFAAIPKKLVIPLARYNVSMRIGLKNNTPFSVNMIGKAGKKTSITEISLDGLTETFVEMTPRKSFLNQKEGILFDVLVRKTVRGNIKASEKTQIFAYENQESEVRVNARGRNHEDLSIAVLANPIVAAN